MKYRELYEKALEVMPKAYAPFSQFKVGAALLSPARGRPGRAEYADSS